jgi:hypothetical protein
MGEKHVATVILDSLSHGRQVFSGRQMNYSKVRRSTIRWMAAALDRQALNFAGCLAMFFHPHFVDALTAVFAANILLSKRGNKWGARARCAVRCANSTPFL